MSGLLALQRRFLASVMHPDESIAAELRSEGGIAAALGMRIYGQAYPARLREVLGKDHAILAGYVGEARWDELCAAYLAAHPSRQPSLRQFGDALPGFLSRHASFAANPEIAELANFERRLLDCFDAPAAPAATWAQLQGLPAERWPELTLRFAPSASRLSTTSNAIAIWIALKAGQVPPGASGTASQWLCWRDAALITQFRSLDDEEAAMLDHFIGGGAFADACERLLSWHTPADVPVRAVEYLARWAAEGLVSEWVGRPA